ncbi:Arginine utilization protein RocB [Tissierella praeacuta DSM 18095]|uniref:Arginine utilization protein RocB n=1 Tax=Tissierella praeacuta DSM 18095 TaxID=1123404 RepID=A0A1M4SSU2_9FIRM|nr:M20/M25/M40 family metallo-hydrolase [Tissierella praeacuta]SHE35256.1 Arginine utilization protein RocB [Tissierella praeacuta DSM 18095]SUP01726.1 succinyl-diaminopimelate desuccinylase [Tissierella praeacuta]
MNKEIAARIEQIAIELTKELSVVETLGELDSVQKIYNIFLEMDYYKENPNHIKFVDIVKDKLGRKSVLSILKGKKGNSKKTVLMIGHTDTVGISDYGSLKEYANRPYELTEKFKEIAPTLPEEVRKDLESGDYLFGRGIFDMKTGDAIIIALMEHISKNIEDFEGNLIYAAVCDEEGNSGGMLSVIPELVKIQEKEGFEYLALLDTDYMTSEFEGDENKYVYIGTVGKLMPSFYVVGKETHVGESFKGIDPNQIASSITNRINLNADFCDVAEGEVSLPPITLKQRDLKPEYSVQIAKTSTLFFNYATHCSTPDEVLVKMKDAATEAFQSTIDNLNIQYERFCKLSGREYKKLPWKARVLTYEELYTKVKSEMGNELNKRIEKVTEEMLKDESIDQRDFSLKLVEEVHSLWSDREPVVIVYYTPPYYPHIYIEGNVPKEKALLNAVADAVSTTKSDYKLVYKKFFPYISDLSYGAAPKDPKIIAALKNNMPGFGTKYDLPLEDMQKLDLPVLDIGPFGKDAHKFTERIEKKYSFEVAPQLVYKTIMNLLKNN